MKRGLLCVALTLCACAGSVIDSDKPLTIEAQPIAPYEFLEQCADLGVGDRIDYRFESKAPVHFEIYYKDGITFVATVTRDVTTTATGDLSAPLPSPFPPQSAYDQRQMQLGFKFAF